MNIILFLRIYKILITKVPVSPTIFLVACLLILKIDLEKAFDRIEWSFIYRSLLFFKFPPNIINLIINCISTSNIVILVNGNKTNYFPIPKYLSKRFNIPIHLNLVRGDPFHTLAIK